MQLVASPGVKVAKKKTTGDQPAKRYGTLIRVSDAFADRIRKVCALNGRSAADHIDEHFLGQLDDQYTDLLAAETKVMGGTKRRGPKA